MQKVKGMLSLLGQIVKLFQSAGYHKTNTDLHKAHSSESQRQIEYTSKRTQAAQKKTVIVNADNTN